MTTMREIMGAGGLLTGNKLQPLATTPRIALLEEAIKITSQDRNAAYGNPEDNFQNIANYWNTYLGQAKQINSVITSQDVAHMMILMKMARLACNRGHYDSLLDIEGYAACARDCQVSDKAIPAA